MTLTEPARPLEADAENPSPDGRSATGRETLRLGGVMTSEGPESMFGGSQSEKESRASSWSKSSSIWGEVTELWSMLVDAPWVSGNVAPKGPFSFISTISGETKEAGEGGEGG